MKDELLTNFIPINRRLFEHHLWCEERDFSRFEAWLFLLKEARFEDTKLLDRGKLVLIKRGQVYASIRFLAESFGWSKKRVETFLRMLVSDAMIRTGTAKETGQGIITICNYDKYNIEKQIVKTPKGTLRGQQGDTEGTKYNKENKENNILSIKGEKKIISESLFKTLNSLLSDNAYIEMLCMNKSVHSIDDMKDYLKAFFVDLQSRGEKYKDEADAKQHFASWLTIQFEKQQKQKGGKYANPTTRHNQKTENKTGMAGIQD